jgi:two-component system sensor histidine kinase TctE
MIDTLPRPKVTESLQFRLATGIVMVLAAGGIAVAVAAFAYGRSAAQQSFDRLLLGAANQVAQSLSLRGGRVIVDLPVSAFELLSLAPRDRIVYGVFGPENELISGYAGLRVSDRSGGFYNGRFGDDPARFVSVSRPFSERSFSGTVDVVFGQTTQARAELAWQITRNALIAVAAVGAIMSALAVLAVQSALRPLRRIERDISERASRDLTPVDVNVPREIHGLVLALNRFIDRIDRQLAVMRTLIADASHQLRTPIAGVRAQAQIALEETDPDRQRAIVARIHERSRNLSRLTDQLLNHALVIHRADAVELQRLDLRSVAAQAVQEIDQALPSTGALLRLDLPEAPVMCDGDAFSLVEACKNLITNAVHHGQTPVTVRVTAAGTTARLGVRDAGSGLPPEVWPEAGTRFARSAGVSSKSAGLGLAIVHAVAQAHGGRMRFSRPEGGGFEAAMELPLARTPRA